MNRTILKTIMTLAVGIALFPSIHVRAQPAGIVSSADLDIALHKLDVLGSVLYVGAHPDDENTAVLSYFSKGRKFRTAYLSLTRGEGGQNLIGPEQGAEIGLIRTQELLSARRIDGAEQYFTRAVDFGYSKTAEETFEFWGKEKVLADIVWVIRKFRPDVVITRFTADNSGGHGHHRASAILAQEAFAAAADRTRFPEQLKYVSPWKARRLFWNGFPQSKDETPNRLRLDTGEYNPLLGRSYNEMAAEGRSQHKSQGFGSAARRGTQYESFELLAGEPAKNDLFEGIDVTWDRVPGGHKAGLLLAGSLRSFDPEHPSRSIPGLLAVHDELAKLADENWVRLKREELVRVIQACGGIWMEAMAGDFAAAPGDEIQVRTTIINRSDQPFAVHSVGFPKVGPDTVLDRPLNDNEPAVIETAVRIPRDFPLSQPYWLDASHQENLNRARRKSSGAQRQDHPERRRTSSGILGPCGLPLDGPGEWRAFASLRDPAAPDRPGRGQSPYLRRGEFPKSHAPAEEPLPECRRRGPAQRAGGMEDQSGPSAFFPDRQI